MDTIHDFCKTELVNNSNHVLPILHSDKYGKRVKKYMILIINESG